MSQIWAERGAGARCSGCTIGTSAAPPDSVPDFAGLLQLLRCACAAYTRSRRPAGQPSSLHRRHSWNQTDDDQFGARPVDRTATRCTGWHDRRDRRRYRDSGYLGQHLNQEFWPRSSFGEGQRDSIKRPGDQGPAVLGRAVSESGTGALRVSVRAIRSRREQIRADCLRHRSNEGHQFLL